MKTKKKIRRVLSLMLVLVMVFVSLANGEPKQVQAASQVKLTSTDTQPGEGLADASCMNASEKYLYLGKKGPKTYNFNIKKKAMVKGATYSWYVKADKGNPNSVTINKKSGVVTAKEAGTAYIRCKITLADGTVYRPEAKVTVRNNITEVKINNLPKDLTIPAGGAYDFNRTVLNTAAGKGVKTEGITRFQVKEDTAGVETATIQGIVLPVKEGEFKIRAVCFQSTAKYKAWLKEKEANETLITAAGEWVTIKVISSNGTGTAATQEHLDKLLKADSVSQITLSTKKAETFVISEGDYSAKTLIVNAPNADVQNHGIFKKITINAIKDSTWVEYANGNIVYLKDDTASFVIDKDVNVKRIVIDRADSKLNIEINGMVEQIVVLQSSELNITGNGKQVPVFVEETAGGSTITSSRPLKLEIKAKTDVVLHQGAEGTSLDKSASEVIVKIENNTKKDSTITTNKSGGEAIGTGKTVISGGTSTTSNPSAGSSTKPSTGPSTIVVTGITITSTGSVTSVASGGTLQMNVTVTPNNATNKAVTWSVINGTGSATISEDGLLTATGDGTVTVKAVAKDGSLKEGTKVITVTLSDAQKVAAAKTAIEGATYTNLAVTDPSDAAQKLEAVQAVVDGVKGTTTAVVSADGANFSVAISLNEANTIASITTATFVLNDAGKVAAAKAAIVGATYTNLAVTDTSDAAQKLEAVQAVVDRVKETTTAVVSADGANFSVAISLNEANTIASITTATFVLNDAGKVAAAKTAIEGATYTDLVVTDTSDVAQKVAAVQAVVDGMKGTTTAVVSADGADFSVAISLNEANAIASITTATFVLNDAGKVAAAKTAIEGATYTDLVVTDTSNVAQKVAAVQAVVDGVKGTTTAVVTANGADFSVAISLNEATATASITTATFVLAKVTNVVLDANGKVTWNNVANETGYDIQLLKDGVNQGVAKNVAADILTTNLLEDMRAAGAGVYTVKVTAKGDGVNYTDGPVSEASSAQTVIQLATVSSGLNWAGKEARWTEVDNASSYEVQLYKDGLKLGEPLVTSSPVSYPDFSMDIETAGLGTYTYKVIAKGNSTLILDAVESQASANLIIALSPPITGYVVAPGTVSGSTKITYQAGSGNVLRYAKYSSDVSITTPIYGSYIYDLLNDGTYKQFDSGANITNVNASEQIALCEYNDSWEAVKFVVIPLKSEDIAIQIVGTASDSTVMMLDKTVVPDDVFEFTLSEGTLKDTAALQALGATNVINFNSLPDGMEYTVENTGGKLVVTFTNPATNEISADVEMKAVIRGEAVTVGGALDSAEIPVTLKCSETFTNGDGTYKYVLNDLGARIIKFIDNTPDVKTDLTIPDSFDGNTVLEIGIGAFWGNEFNKVTLPNNLSKIETSAFNSCGITELVIPDNLNISAFAFIGNNITKITIGNNVTLENYVFLGNDPDSFRNVYQNDGVGTYQLINEKWTKIIE